MKRILKAAGIFLVVCLGLAGAGAAVLAVLVMTDVYTSFDPEKLETYSQTTWVLDREGELISGVYATENRVYLSIEQIPEQVRNAFIAAEDVRFYKHHGVDPVRIVGALAANLRSGSLSQGASTITQQLIKNTHLTADKTWSRKFEEAILALKVERAYTKDQILEMYLNYVYFGNGAYGIQMAAYQYFEKSVDELTLTEAAALAATLKAPSNYAPHIEPENNQRRREQILDTMLEEGFISAKEASSAKAQELVLRQDGRQSLKQDSWYLDVVLEEAEQLLGVSGEAIMEMGLRIHTAMDSQVQAICDEVYANDALFPADSADGTPCQSALVLMDSRTGEVLALEGGRTYEVRKGFNRALDGQRQPGSVLKPLAVYAPALERRIVTPATVILDEPTDFDGYTPRNYGDVYYGPVTLRTAAARSLNVPAVQLLSQMGGFAGYESLNRFHIQPDVTDTGLSLAVGSMKNGVSPLRLCAAYASLSAAGTYREPVFIRRIEDRDGNLLYQAEETAEQVLDPATAFVLNNLLQSASSWGTAKALKALEVPIAAKTGTVGFEGSLNRDAWCAAYTPSLAAVCWMGFDETDADHALPSGVTGGKNPTSLVYEVLSRLDLPAEEFVQPAEGVTWAALDALSLQNPGQPYLAGPYTLPEDKVYEVFLTGTEPTQVSDIRTLPQAPQDLTVSAGENSLPLVEFTVPDEGAVYHIYRSYRGNVQQIGTVQGIYGSRAAFLDTSAQRLYTYEYFVIAQFEQSGLYAEATPSVSFTVPLLPFGLPWWDATLEPEETPDPTQPSPSPQQTQEPSPEDSGDGSLFIRFYFPSAGGMSS